MCEHRVGRAGFPFLSVYQRGPFLCYYVGMELALIVGIGAFVILGIMFALLWASSKRDWSEDSVTQDIIVKANTAPVIVQAPVVTQEEED